MNETRVTAAEVHTIADAAIRQRLQGSGGWHPHCIQHIQTESDGSVSIWVNSGGNALTTANALWRFRVSWKHDAEGRVYLNIG